MAEFRQAQRPYPGLRPFESWEDEIFFGREEHTNRLLDILQQQRFLAVIGPSGSGKSSLVRAGLLPALSLGSLGTGYDWRIAVFRPGNRPIQTLARALLEPDVLGPELIESGRETGAEAALVEAELRRGSLGIIDVVKSARTRQNQADPFNLLVLVDQFEELFTYHEAGAEQADESTAFVNLLLAPRKSQDTRLFVAITMRTDFLGACVRFLELPDAINRAQYLTPRLSREQIERANVGPARMFEGDVEPTLVAELINSISEDSDQLPILQHALARMWDSASRRDTTAPLVGWEDCQAAGGIGQALSRHADDVLASLGPAGQIEKPLAPRQQAAEWLFRAITERRSADGGGQAVRRPQTLARVSAWSGLAWEEFLPAVEAYAADGVNFLRADAPVTSETVVDISHEALIRQWQRLRDWVDDETRLAAEFRRWRDRAEDWQKAESEEAGSGALLTGADLVRALEWRDGGDSARGWQPSGAWAERYGRTGTADTAGQFEKVIGLIDRSYKSLLQAERRKRRQRRRLKAVTGFSVLALLVTGMFAWTSYQAQLKAEAAAVWSSLDFDEGKTEIDVDRAERLLRLAADDETLKQAVIEGIPVGTVEEQALGRPFIYQPRAFIIALLGTSPTKRRELAESLRVSPPNDPLDVSHIARVLALSELGEETPLAEILDALANKKGPRKISAREQVVEVLNRAIGKLPGDQVGQAADLFIQAVRTAIYYPSFGDAIRTLTQRSPAPVVEKYFAAMATTTISQTLEGFGTDLSTAVSNVTEGQAASIFDKFLVAMPAADEAGHLEYYRPAFIAVAEKVPKNEAEVLAWMVDEQLQSTQDPEQKDYLNSALDVLKTNAAKAESAPAADPPASASGKAGADGNQGVEAGPSRLGSGAVVEFEHFMKALEQKDREKYRIIGERLKDPAGTLPESQIVSGLNRLLRLAAVASDQKQLRVIGDALNALGVGSPEKEALSVANRLETAILSSVSENRLNALGAGLGAASKRIPEALVRERLDRLLSAMKRSNRVGVRRALASGTVELAARLPEPQALAVFRDLLASLRDERYWEARSNFNETLDALARRLPADQTVAVAGEILALLREDKNPVTAEEWLLSRLNAVANRPEGAWEAFETLYAAWHGEDDAGMRERIWQSVETASEKVPPERQGNVMERLFSQLPEGRAEDRTLIAKALRAAAKRLPEPSDQAAALVERFLQAMATDRGAVKDISESLSRGLEQVAAKVEERQAKDVFDRLWTAKDNQSGNQEVSKSILKGLTEVAARLQAEQADAALNRFLTERTAEVNGERRRVLEEGITALVKKATDGELLLKVAVEVGADQEMFEAAGKQLARSLEQATQERLAKLTEKAYAGMFEVMDSQSQERLVREAACESGLPDAARLKLLEQSVRNHEGGGSTVAQIEAISDGLKAAYSRLSQPLLMKYGHQLAEKTQSGRDHGTATILFQNLAEIARHVESESYAASLLFQALKNPLAPPGELEKAVRERFPDAPQQEEPGYWKLVEWADAQIRKGRFTGLDLEAPLVLPAPVKVKSDAPSTCKQANTHPDESTTGAHPLDTA